MSHRIRDGQPLAHGHQQVDPGQARRPAPHAEKGEQGHGGRAEDGAGDNGPGRAEPVEDPPAEGRQAGAHDAPGQQEAAGGEGPRARADLRVVGDEVAQGQDDPLDEDDVEDRQGEGAVREHADAQQGRVRAPGQGAEGADERRGAPDQDEHPRTGETGRRGDVHRQDEAGEPGRERGELHRREGDALGLVRLADGQRAQQQGREQEGQQDEEDGPPAEGPDEVAAQRRAHRRCDGRDEGGHPHHGAEAVEGRLLEDDVEHEGQGDAGADPLDEAAPDEQVEPGRRGAQDRARHEERHGRQEQGPGAEAAVEQGGDRHDRRQDEEVAGGDPLHPRRGDAELRHERGEGDVHGRLHDDAREGHDADGDDGEHQPGVEAPLEACHEAAPRGCAGPGPARARPAESTPADRESAAFGGPQR